MITNEQPIAGSNNAFADCLAELRRYDRERYLTAILSPLPARRNLIALYAFNLELSRVADLVNEKMLGLIRLQWWRDVLKTVAEGGHAPNAVATALGEALQAGAVQRESLVAMVDGRERDLDKSPFDDLADLQSYIAGTAGALLRAAARIGDGSDDNDALPNLGLAYGLAGIVRAVPFHAQHGRICLPLNILRVHGLSAEDVLARRASGKLRSVVADLAAAGVKALHAAKGASSKDVGLAALLHGELAKRHLKTIMNRRYDPYDPPPSGSGLSALRLQWRRWRGRL